MSDGEILAVDLGATSIRFRTFTRDGEPISARSRRPTPYPCRPERLVALVAARAQREPVGRIGMGFPGEIIDGVVQDAANLTRLGGLASPLDPEMAAMWRGYDLQKQVAAATGCEVRVINDAATAALGCARGEGVELVVTLGTGCGLALVTNGVLAPVRDVGAEMLRGSATYDEILGEQGRRDDESGWMLHVVSAVTALASEFEATTIHLAGGNARRLSPSIFGSWSSVVVIERDEPALLGAWRLAAS